MLLYLREIVYFRTQKRKYRIYELLQELRLFQSMKRRQGMRGGSLSKYCGLG